VIYFSKKLTCLEQGDRLETGELGLVDLRLLELAYDLLKVAQLAHDLDQPLGLALAGREARVGHERCDVERHLKLSGRQNEYLAPALLQQCDLYFGLKIVN
jgi:hypothetical protein